MQLEVPNLMENELAKQMEDDLRRLLAGTDIRANGTAITADSLDANIKNLSGRHQRRWLADHQPVRMRLQPLGH